MFLIRCKGTENKWYIQVFYTFMKDFCSFFYTFMKDFCSFYYTFMNDFLSYNKMRGEILTTIDDNYSRQLLTIIYNKNTARCAYKNNQKSRLNFYDNLWQLKSSIMDNSWIYFVWVGRMRRAHWQPTTKWFVLNGEWDEWGKSIKQQEPWFHDSCYLCL